MPSFESLFLESKGQPVVYKGQTIQMLDRLIVADRQTLIVRFESVNAGWRQGVRLDIDGSFKVNGQTVNNAIVLWQDTAPREVVLKVSTKKGECRVRNVWDVGDGVEHSWHNGAAMIVETSDAFRRYRCNDGRADDDFNDLIFNVELIR
jgi:hypothetical protein